MTEFQFMQTDVNTGELLPFAGDFNVDKRNHLLRRTLFGISAATRKSMEGLGLEMTVSRLLTSDVAPPVPVNDYNTEDLIDPKIGFGQPWIHDSSRDNADLVSARVVSLKSWWIKNMLEQGDSVTGKMVFFWHNHLATQSWEVFWPHLTYRHYEILRKHALGNVKQLIKDITLDPHMLLYLNGALNRADAPDENYARELQELFCVGKGPLASFTEADVRAAARVLTGHSIDWEKGGEYLYRWYWHDTEDKHFSSFYGNRVIKGKSGLGSAAEVDELLDMIFENPEVALFIVRKLYRFFAYSEIDDTTEIDVIEPLAQILRDNDFEIKPVLKALFTSAHFFDQSIIGASIKTPLDFLIGFWRTGGVGMPAGATMRQEKQIRTSMLWTMFNLGLEVMDPPNVSGYPAYHQFPQYDKSWITTNTITQRALITDSLVFWGFWSEDLLTNIDLVKHISSLPNPDDPILLVDDLITLHLPFAPSDASKSRLISILLSGQSNPGYWTAAWYDHLENPGDEMKKAIVETRLKVMFQYFLQLSEFHLI